MSNRNDAHRSDKSYVRPPKEEDPRARPRSSASGTQRNKTAQQGAKRSRGHICRELMFSFKNYRICKCDSHNIVLHLTGSRGVSLDKLLIGYFPTFASALQELFRIELEANIIEQEKHSFESILKAIRKTKYEFAMLFSERRTGA